ncbi:MAG TPA: hypothetical protein VGD26_06480 [Chitinophagaceae bacterium]
MKGSIPAVGVARADSAAGAEHPLPAAVGVVTSLVQEEESQVPLAAAVGRQRINYVV